MALILNIETSTSVCSVSIGNGGKLTDFEEAEGQKTHASQLTVFIDKLLKRNRLKIQDFDALAVSKGPGSYTGLRIGVSTVKGIAYAANLPVLAINTLDAMVSGFVKTALQMKWETKNHIICPLLDARRMEVYACMRDFQMNEIMETQAIVIDENTFSKLLQQKKIYFVGNATEKVSTVLQHKNAIFISDFLPSAKHLVGISETAFMNKQFVDVAYFEPFYLKDFVATKPRDLLKKISKNNKTK
ncbi:MAG: tRNA (adenosine(37)-N6)-threonylcarbamoyltransferase complex dimerization subunit type 1 TsaB [Bacteroidia bacterium]|nr:MAG: tRNA (adenosine(37)-N6)-threonylcarbamoyltransferase complex dimerization subunit type 1 TsaB [Bacteroidia bacterium]